MDVTHVLSNEVVNTGQWNSFAPENRVNEVSSLFCPFTDIYFS